MNANAQPTDSPRYRAVPAPTSAIRINNAASTPPAQAVRQERLRAALELLEGDGPPRGLLARANRGALQLLEHAARESAMAGTLVRPAGPAGRLFILHRLRQLAWSSAAIVTMVILRSGMLTGLEEGRRISERLAQTHVDRHVYGDFNEADV